MGQAVVTPVPECPGSDAGGVEHLRVGWGVADRVRLSGRRTQKHSHCTVVSLGNTELACQHLMVAVGGNGAVWMITSHFTAVILDWGYSHVIIRSSRRELRLELSIGLAP